MSLIYAISRCAVALIFFYHGLVPKLLFKNEQEVLMNDVMIPFVSESTALLVSGWMEVVLGVLFLVFYRNLILNYLAIFFLGTVSIAILITLPQLYQKAFNPFSLNLGVGALLIINILAQKFLKPSTS